MKQYDPSFARLERYLETEQRPDFDNNLAQILEKKRPSRYTLFEFYLSNQLFDLCSEGISYEGLSYERQHRMVDTFRRLGYDYVNMRGSDFRFLAGQQNNKTGASSTSLNTSAGLDSWEALEQFIWPEPEDFGTERLDILGEYMPEGMGLVVYTPAGGVLESLIELVGFDNLCYLLADDEDFVAHMCNEIGRRLYTYYAMCCRHKHVRAVIYNDDWGFNTQTMISPADLRRYVYPWVHKISDEIHRSGKYAIIHSCGNLGKIMPDIYGELAFDGKHSYEDVIMPVEEAYGQWHGEMGILGGIDMDFLCRQSREAIYGRAARMLERTAAHGAYALGSGNSIAGYVPMENYLAMIAAAIWNR